MAVATAVAIASLAISAGTTGMSFAQAGKQKKAQRQAERDADEAMQEARKKLQINVYDELGIQKEPYELEREALLSQGAQAIQAGVESERGAAATAGRIQMAQQEGQAGVRSAFGQELSALEKMSAAEESRLRDMGVKLDLGEVEGAQLAAANAEKLSAQATQQGMQGLASTAQQALQFVPLYTANAAAQKDALSKMSFSPEQFQKFQNVTGKDGGASATMGALGTGEFTNLDFQKIGQLDTKQFSQFKKELSPQQKQMLFRNKQYTDLYSAFNPY